jgi:hypothetical protein
MAALKKIAGDQSSIDYLADRVGVRVRRDQCRPIVLQRGRWTEYGVPYSLPVDSSQLYLQKTGISSLATSVNRVEESSPDEETPSELRRLILGEMTFDDALSKK